MAKYCNVCRQSYSVDYDSCPFCDAPALLDRSRPRKPVSADEPTPLPAPPPFHREMDLAAPVGAGQIEPRAESSDHCENGLPPLGPRSSTKMLLGQPAGSDPHGEATKGQGDVEIDLGAPVLGGRGGDAGPPSGASFVSWTSLINKRKDFEDDHPAKPDVPGASARALLGNAAETQDGKSATKLSPGDSATRFPIWFYIAAVPIGILLAFLLKLIL